MLVTIRDLFDEPQALDPRPIPVSLKSSNSPVIFSAPAWPPLECSEGMNALDPIPISNSFTFDPFTECHLFPLKLARPLF